MSQPRTVWCMVMEPDPVMRGLRQQPHATVQVEQAKREGIEPCHDLPVGDQGPVGLLPALTLHYPKHTGSPLSCESEDDEASGGIALTFKALPIPLPFMK